MNGAEKLVSTLVAGGIDTCFANPGTSEMHFVAALDKVPGMRAVLTLFEGVATGAADGYARMLDRPACTLLHLGPGLANGLSNLHNAARAGSRILNIVGDHATYHRRFDAPLTSDIEGAARPFSHWIRTSTGAGAVARDAAAAIAAASGSPGEIATLILPADTAWSEAPDEPVSIPAVKAGMAPDPRKVLAIAALLKRKERTALFLSGKAVRQEGLKLAGQIAAATGVRLIAQGFNARMERGAGRVGIERLPYPVDQALAALRDVDNLVLIDAKAPVAFFAYPGKPSEFAPPGCSIHSLASPGDDSIAALVALRDEVGAGGASPELAEYEPPASPEGAISSEKLGALLCAMIPENAIVVDEAITTGRAFYDLTRNARPHDLIQNMGGSIGYGLPVATGAAIACPDRKVICLESDGSGMYMPQALWTQARENLDVTTLLFANRAYRILSIELANVGAEPGKNAKNMIDIDRPTLDWCGLARSMGVTAHRAASMEEVALRLEEGLRSGGPNLIEVVL